MVSTQVAGDTQSDDHNVTKHITTLLPIDDDIDVGLSNAGFISGSKDQVEGAVLGSSSKDQVKDSGLDSDGPSNPTFYVTSP